jgi:hypothetical protein
MHSSINRLPPLSLARSLASSENLPTPATGTCRLISVERWRGRRREKTELAGYKLYQTVAALAACAPEAQGGQKRNAARYHCIVHRKRAGFGAQLPRSWRKQIKAGCNRAATRGTPENTRTDKKIPESAKKRKNSKNHKNAKRAKSTIHLPTPQK